MTFFPSNFWTHDTQTGTNTQSVGFHFVPASVTRRHFVSTIGFPLGGQTTDAAGSAGGQSQTAGRINKNRGTLGILARPLFR